LIDDKNPSTGFDKGRVDHVRAIAIVKRRAGRNPKKLYIAYKRAIDKSLPPVEDICSRS
jgi:hypothetical protein